MIGSPIRLTSSVAVLLAALPLAQAQSVASTTPVEDLANHALGLERSQVLQLVQAPDPAEPIDVGGIIAGRPVILQLEPVSVLADDFQLLAVGADGVATPVEPAPETTLRGTLLGQPGSQVAASLLDDGLHARILVESGEYWIEPLARAVPTAAAGTHVLYSTADVIQNAGVCATEAAQHTIEPFGGIGTTGAGQYAAAAGYVAELACDSDYEYYLDYGSVGAVQNRITSVINTMNLQYESEVDISHALTTILVRTSSNQPYTSTDANTLLNQFRNEWNSNQSGIQRDVAQLFTGKEINSSTIGIAWLGVVCNLSYGYSMVQSDFNGNFSSATDLSAHELGHNWSADHCSCTSNTMNPYITSANTFHPSLTIPEIVAFRDSRSCLDAGNPPPPASSMTVGSIALLTINQSKGSKSGAATVTIVDDNGAPVSGVTVTVVFSGDFSETRSGTTGGNGSVTVSTVGTGKGKVSFDACVSNVAGGSLSYVPSVGACN